MVKYTTLFQFFQIDGLKKSFPVICYSGMEQFICREKCGACCIAPSISSSIPGMPDGKPAGVTCVNLDENFRCRIFGDPARPAVCASLQPNPEMCRSCREEALAYLSELEKLTAP